MSKMGSHGSFGYLKLKLWPKERLRMKQPIWLSTTKSQELPWFICIQMVCDISLESSQQMFQLFFRHHFNCRSTKEVMSIQSCGSPNFKNFKTCNLRIPKQNGIWVQAPWLGTENIINGKVVASPKSRPWWVLRVLVCLWFIYAPKVFQLPTNQLVVRFVYVCVNNWPACHLSWSPSWSSNTPFYPQSVVN
jgi:hypothetical protein